MKKKVNIFLFVILLLSVSCNEKDKVQDVDTAVSTSFNIGDISYVADTTIEYQTDFGQILKVVGKNFELYIVLSDTNSKTFNIVYNVVNSDIGKARCILKMNDTYRYSYSGTIEYNMQKKTGTFDLVMDDLHLINGKILADTIIHKPIIDFTKISMTDDYGMAIDSADINDWGIRTDLSVIERSVFSLKTASTISNSFVVNAYPNPPADRITIEADIPADYGMDVILVNENFEIQKRAMHSQFPYVMFLIDETINSGDYYRFYYRIYSGSEQFFGSGDVKVQK